MNGNFDPPWDPKNDEPVYNVAPPRLGRPKRRKKSGQKRRGRKAVGKGRRKKAAPKSRAKAPKKKSHAKPTGRKASTGGAKSRRKKTRA